jgi:hypothetical protein
MKKAVDKLKRAWEENPLQVIVIGALAATAAAKLLDASTNARNARVWQNEVNRRIMMKSR